MFFLLFNKAAIAQEEIDLSQAILPNTFGLERNALKLSNKLTEGKTTEREKFNAIYTWVTKNIRYNYFSYLAPTGSAEPQISRILRYKSGICLDYAHLMDTLCGLAGIQNVTVYGYAKDDLFDVNDSLYMDNHAWNAVKLDGNWYVYDVTWASGRYVWVYTRWSKRVAYWIKKIEGRVKEQVVTFKSRKTSECNSQQDQETWVTYTKYSFSGKNRFLLRLLRRFKLRTNRVFEKVERPDYYLTNPEVFSINHFPDNPYWSLTAGKEKIREYEADSAYYYLSDSVYIRQQRMGRKCGDCDNYFSLDRMNKEKQMKRNSAAFNNRNRFITWLCNYHIGDLYFEQAIPVEDSLAKVSLLDSALAYFANAKLDLYQCMTNVHNEGELQKAKNNRKEQQLYEDNRRHIDFMRELVKATYMHTRKMDYFVRQVQGRYYKYKRKHDRIKNIDLDIDLKNGNFKTKEQIKELLDKRNKRLAAIDSVEDLLRTKISLYNAQLKGLGANIWAKIKLQNSLITPFENGSFYRWYYRMDNYKKTIVDERANIEHYKQQYAAGLSETIFIPSDTCADVGLEILRLIDQRNDWLMESLKLCKIMVRERLVRPDSLIQLTEAYKAKIQENMCWIGGGSSRLTSVVYGYSLLVYSEKEIEQAIRWESKIEFERYKWVNQEINRRKRKFRSVPVHNLKVTSKRKSAVLKYKRQYLKSLRQLRKKQKAER